MAGDTTASLNPLPTELHIQIARLLSNRQLLLLRRASKDFATNSIDVFAERFFQRRSHLYTTHSLTALRDISAKPVFARHIKRVEFVVTTVEDDRGLMRNRDIADETPALKAKDRYYQECEDLEDCHEQLMGEIFQNLAKLKVGKNVSVTTNLWQEELPEDSGKIEKHATWEAHGGVHGVSTFLRRICPWATRADLRDGDIEMATNSILSALACTDHAVESLDLGYRSHTTLEEVDLNGISSTEMQRLVDVFSKIKTLKIGFESDDGGWTTMAQLLEAAVNVEHLAIDLEDMDDLPEIIETFERGSVKKLSLSCMKGCAADLAHALGRQHESLHHLEIQDVELDDYSWPLLCAALYRETIGLDSIRLVDLRQQGEEYLFHVAGMVGTDFGFQGREEVKEGLKLMDLSGHHEGGKRAKTLGRDPDRFGRPDYADW